MYNLSNTQKEVLRSLVRPPATALAIVWSHQGPEILGVDSGEAKLPDSVTVSMLRSLDKLDLISMSEGPQAHYCEIEILQGAIDLVLNDFQETAVPPDQEGDYLARLVRHNFRRLLGELFNEADFKDLCYDLDINHEDVPGNSRIQKLNELFDQMDRHHRLHELIGQVMEKRPKVSARELFLPTKI